MNSFTWPKLIVVKVKVKYIDWALFTHVLTFFLIIFCPRIVNSIFYCMFTPSQRSDTKTNTKMNSSSVPFEVRFANYVNKRIERAKNQEDLEDAKAILKAHKEMYKATFM